MDVLLRNFSFVTRTKCDIITVVLVAGVCTQLMLTEQSVLQSSAGRRRPHYLCEGMLELFEHRGLQLHTSSVLSFISCTDKVRTRKEISTLQHLNGCFSSPEKQGCRPLVEGGRGGRAQWTWRVASRLPEQST